MIGRLKLALRMAGVLASAVGLMCLPIGYGVSPKRDLSPFFNLVDMGAFIKAALVLIPLGMAVFVVSYLLPGDDPDDAL